VRIISICTVWSLHYGYELDSNVVLNFAWTGIILRYKSRVWVGADLALQQKLISAFHCIVVGGHSSMLVTYNMMKKLFAWKGLKSPVHDFVKSCIVCQQAKPDRAKNTGLLQPLAVPVGA
jgi:hypothetical protein